MTTVEKIRENEGFRNELVEMSKRYNLLNDKYFEGCLSNEENQEMKQIKIKFNALTENHFAFKNNISLANFDQWVLAGMQ